MNAAAEGREINRCASGGEETVRVTLRPACPADEPFLFRLFAGGRPDLEWITYLSEEQKTELYRRQFRCEQEQFKKNYPDAQFCIVLLEGEPVGRLYVHRGKEEFRGLAITLLPEFRNMGIGSELINGMLRDASKAGKPVRIHVAWYNYAARALYERLGFRVVEDGGAYCEMQCEPEVKNEP
ncbi:FR47-like protein [Pelotomaculum schinkii]|uniref:FR47-like protein n=1 Tax=Pelotomaculum schinkii TaxID=78350 RepID=A0A4Y7RGV8_9FIRM|nr:GNAT family N-acetyltransferase [Pelotomaculum schinkii]TEB08245.1 FR47-like protein [Pelotomaculum schinkii]